MNKDVFIAEAKAKGLQLTDEQLAEVSGGGSLSKARFKVGTRVCYHRWANKRDPARYGVVKYSLGNALYSVLCDDGETVLCGPDNLERVK
ncbi:MAG: hypothetical protein PHY12_04920 [Eubacteriales bacterium]|nr:hypothetical protein [Eubacteriales bacterium]